jgi:5-oxoprolinase (ATP-hydrolysing)
MFRPRTDFMDSDDSLWQFWIDRGGTFTDLVARLPDGSVHTEKLLSENPSRYQDAAVESVARTLRRYGVDTPPRAVIKMGTTVATNALLERKGEPTALVITAGLEDSVRIGTQQRPDIFALDIRLPAVLYARVIGAVERVSTSGGTIVPLDEPKLAADLEAIRTDGIDAVAIVFLHGYRYTEHEERAAKIARETGFSQVSVSHEVNPLMKLVPRADTTLVDAYLSPVLRRYVSGVRDGLETLLERPQLFFMQSHGGLTEADRFGGADSILSGPAGGVVGMSKTAAQAGFHKLIGFDMGGTSTDVSLYDGTFERTTDAAVAGVRVTTPMMKIHTVAAGGGSVFRFAHGRLRVGPESAGAVPGPACYGNDGPLTVTDANVFLGRIQPDFFPRVFGDSGDEPLDTEIVRRRFDALAAQVEQQTGLANSPEALAWGGLSIAIETMTNAIKQISIQRGHDLSDFTLCSFGGAAGQHVCRIAGALGIRRILIHPWAGVLSAYGMGLADIRIVRQEAVEASLSSDALSDIFARFEALEQRAMEELRRQTVTPKSIEVERRFNLRASGTDTFLPVVAVPGESVESLSERFRATHTKTFGFSAEIESLVVDSIEVELIGYMETPEDRSMPASGGTPEPAARRRVWIDETWLEAPLYIRNELSAGDEIRGPAIVVETSATTILEPGWLAQTDDRGYLLVERAAVESNTLVPDAPDIAVPRQANRADPILLEVFNNLFMHVATQMGVILEKTAHSVNIKERMDFSCAIFDAHGELIANAPHMPVHLGSMGECVRSLLSTRKTLPGEVYLSNAPYSGGTHLPDITAITPVFDTVDAERLLFVVASRAHHADIGGITPGSMPPFSTSILEEGIVLDNVRIVQRNHFDEASIRGALATGPYPARNPDQNIADLKAQIAANQRGVAELKRLVERFDLGTVEAYMGYIKINAERCVRETIDRIASGHFESTLDSGEALCVQLLVDREQREVSVRFEGTSPVSRTNLNAPSAVTKSAVLYVFRALVEDDIPLNAGCLKPITIEFPASSLLNPEYPAAVVGGNVETSQCIVDALFGALGVMASSQGTMNNFTFGNDRYQYYETLCGGAGAGADFDGASAVHTHMTNSRLTDPEVLEWRFPVRLRRFQIRHGSGGDGLRRGGDGIVRDIEFLEPMDAAILSNRRRVPPFGLAGGEPGKHGKNMVIRSDGSRERLGATAMVRMRPGDRFVIETPGGGGYGKRPDRVIRHSRGRGG